MKSTYSNRNAIVLTPKKEIKPVEINQELRDRLNWVMKTKGALASKIIHEWVASDPKEPNKEYIEI